MTKKILNSKKQICHHSEHSEGSLNSFENIAFARPARTTEKQSVRSGGDCRDIQSYNDKKEKCGITKKLKFRFRILAFICILFLISCLLFLLSPSKVSAATYADGAKDLCKTQKEKIDATAWAKGPCLGKLPGTEIFVDVAHSPRQNIDNQNTCNVSANDKWIELNMDCSSAQSPMVNLNATYNNPNSSSSTNTNKNTETSDANSALATASENLANTIGAPDGTAMTKTRLVDFIKNRPAFYQIWQAMIGLVDIFVLIGFIIFALANVFHIKYDEYQAKKAIPGLIVGVILANLSWPICIFLIDVVQHLTDIFIRDPDTFFCNLANLYGWMWSLATLALAGGAWAAIAGVGFAGIILALILFLFPLLIVLAIGGILWARGLVIMVLVSAAPLAFLLNSFPVEIPYLSGLAKKWWEWFPKWLFIGPVMFFLFWLAFMVDTAGSINTYTCTRSTGMAPAATDQSSGKTDEPSITPAQNQENTENSATQTQIINQKTEKYAKNLNNWDSIAYLKDNASFCVDNGTVKGNWSLEVQPKTGVGTNSDSKCKDRNKIIILSTDCDFVSSNNKSVSFQFWQFLNVREVFAQEENTSDPEASDTSWENEMPYIPSQKKTDWLAAILSIIIGILAITIPWGMMSEITNAIKKITNPAWNAFKKSDTAKWATVPYHKARGLFAKTGIGQKILARKGKLEAIISTEKAARENVEKDILETEETNIRFRHAQSILRDQRYVGTKGPYQGRNIPDFAKLSYLKPLISIAREKAPGFANGPINIDDPNRIKQLFDGSFEGTASDAVTLLTQLEALKLQSSNKFHPEYERAMRTLGDIASKMGISVDQLRTSDFGRGEVGPPIARAGAPAVDNPKLSESLRNFQEAFHEGVKISGEDIEKLAEIMADNTTESLRDARILSDEMTRSIHEIASREKIDPVEVASRMQEQLSAAESALSRNNISGAAAYLKSIGIGGMEGVTDPEIIRPKITQAMNFINSYRTDPANAVINFNSQTRNSFVENEQMHLINRVAGPQGVSISSPDAIGRIKRGETEPISALGAQQQQILISALQQLDRKINDRLEGQTPTSLPETQTRQGQTQPTDEEWAREQEFRTRFIRGR